MTSGYCEIRNKTYGLCAIQDSIKLPFKTIEECEEECIYDGMMNIF